MIECQCNRVEISGRICQDLVFSHMVYGENFYQCYLEVERLSGERDVLPLLLSQRLCKDCWPKRGNAIFVRGQLRSYNRIIDGISRLELKIFAREIFPTKEADQNSIDLAGYLCKPPIYRTTPFGREITDMLIAANRMYHKSDYIPVIAWGKNARFAKKLSVGKKIMITGRIQSREYEKQLPDGSCFTRTAYEVSASSISCLKEE